MDVKIDTCIYRKRHPHRAWHCPVRLRPVLVGGAQAHHQRGRLSGHQSALLAIRCWRLTEPRKIMHQGRKSWLCFIRHEGECVFYGVCCVQQLRARSASCPCTPTTTPEHCPHPAHGSCVHALPANPAPPQPHLSIVCLQHMAAACTLCQLTLRPHNHTCALSTSSRRRRIRAVLLRVSPTASASSARAASAASSSASADGKYAHLGIFLDSCRSGHF